MSSLCTLVVAPYLSSFPFTPVDLVWERAVAKSTLALFCQQ
jgi:hypothetical protein